MAEKMREFGKWIPIDEEEPHGGDHVLVTLYWEEDDWYEVCEMDYGVLKYEEDKILERVTAWMEMPEPYKREKDETC